MEDAELRRWLDRLESRLDVSPLRLSVALVEEVRDQSILVLKRAYGPDNQFVHELESIKSARSTTMILPAFDLLNGQLRRTRYEVRRTLRNVRFSLDLETITLVEPPPAAELDSAALDRLAAMLRGLISEVEQAPLRSDDREQLLTTLESALFIVQNATGPEAARADLQRVLGHAVAHAGRGGIASPLWKRVAEFIVIAEATVSLGLGVAAIAQPNAVHVEVECRVAGLPALPAPPPPPPPPENPAPPTDMYPPGQTVPPKYPG